MKYESIYDVSKTALSIMNTCITETAKGSGIQAISGDPRRYVRRSVEVVHSHLGADVHP